MAKEVNTTMQPGLVSVLGQRLFPRLLLGGLHAIRGTCTALSAAVKDTKAEVWLQVARCVLRLHITLTPQDLPSMLATCSLSSGRLCQRATRSAFLTMLLQSRSAHMSLPGLPDSTTACAQADMLNPSPLCCNARAIALYSARLQTIKVWTWL